MAHDYDGIQASRAMRKRSKLGNDGITLDRLEELLGSQTGRFTSDFYPHCFGPMNEEHETGKGWFHTRQCPLYGSSCGSGNQDSKDLNPHKQGSTDTQGPK